MPTHKLTTLSLLLALSLALFTLEAALPVVPIPGVKLGLSQVVTVYVLYRYGSAEAAALLLARIILSAIFAGQAAAILFSLSGGALSLLAMTLAKRRGASVITASLAGAVSHNAGQLLAAACVTGTWSVLAYGPVLFLAAVFAGAAVGGVGREMLRHLTPFLWKGEGPKGGGWL